MSKKGDIDWKAPVVDNRSLLDLATEYYKEGMPRRTIVRELNMHLQNAGMITSVTYAKLDSVIKRHVRNTQPEILSYMEAINNSRRFTNIDYIDSDCVVVCHDFHIPYHHISLTDKMLKIAKVFGAKDLAIIGDFVDLTLLSTFSRTHNEAAMPTTQLREAARILDVLFEHFDKIYWCMGNHDVRFMKFAEAKFDHTDLGKLVNLSLDRKQLVVSKYRYMVLNNKWRLTHPGNYSRIPPQVERKLAEKFHMNVIGSHGHLFGMGTDISGKYLSVQAGGMVDGDKVWYLKEKDTTHPKWVPGFWVIRNDKLFPFIEHPHLTDWEFWLSLQL